MTATITVRLLTCADIVAALIRGKTWSEYSHAEFILDDGTTLGAHADGGVAIRPAGYAVFTAVRVIRLAVTEEQKAAVLAFAMAQVGKPYDMAAIAGIVAHRDWRNPDHWFCSELVIAALEAGGVIQPIAMDIDRITPRDVLLILSAMFG